MSLGHLLQRIAGKDNHLLDHSSDAERVMYNCLGILVFVISLLALCSISYSLYLVHFPKGFNQTTRDFLNIIFITLLSFVWTLIVFNFYRFSLSSVSTHKQEFTIGLLPRLTIQVFFAILIGLSISIPLTVVVTHQEYKEEVLKNEADILTKLNQSIDKKYNVELLKLYKNLIVIDAKNNTNQSQLQDLQSVSLNVQDQVTQLQEESTQLNENSEAIKTQISTLREKINFEKEQLKIAIQNDDGLIKNIQKAYAKNSKLMLLICIFICLILVFPSLYQALYIPGIYDYLVEYENHETLSNHGVLPESRNVFIGTEPVHIPYYTFPEELLREKKLELERLSKKDAQSIFQKESSTSV